MTYFSILYPDGSTVDFKDDLVIDSLVISKRCDEAFAKGSCQIISDIRAENIPPYTLANIDGNKYFLSSDATHYQTVNGITYVQNVEIIELTSILECFILGTKAFSGNRLTDKQKVDVIANLIRNKYQVVLNFNNAFNGLTNKYEFFFANGTTVYDALTQICVRNNKRPVVYDVSYINGVMNIYIGLYDLGTYQITNISSDKIITRNETQSTDNYCKYLETEANNVIDRDTLTYDYMLTERGPEGDRLTIEDNSNGKIYANNRINRVTKWEVNGGAIPYFGLLGGADFFFNFITGISPSHDYAYQAGLSGSVETLRMWCTLTARENQAITDTQLYQLMLSWCNEVGADIEHLLNSEYKVLSNAQYTFTKDGVTYTDWNFSMQPNDLTTFYLRTRATDITATILEKTQYDALAETLKPKYCYYTQGSKIIDGLHLKINADIWGAISSLITGSYRGQYIDYIGETYGTSTEVEKTGTGWYTGATFRMYGTPLIDTSSYNVEYEAISNPMIIDTKTDTPINEAAYKGLGRSYGISASQIDFDKLVDSMSLSNNMLGKPEYTIEILLESGDTLPNLTNEIRIDNSSKGYLLNYEIRYSISYKTMTLFLTKSIQNIAQAIGVPYQYHATRLPVEGIIERPIRSEIEVSNSYKTELINAATNGKGIYIYFIFMQGNSQFKVVSRASLYKRNNKMILYCEAQDNFAFGEKQELLSTTEKITTPVTYSDANNEAAYMSYKIGILNINNEQSRSIPSATLFNANDFQIGPHATEDVYKDAYEKLTFTIEIK